MAKQRPGGDLFGIKDDGGKTADSDGDEGEGEGVDYVILQITPAQGWQAVFRDPTSAGSHRVLGLTSFALVEVLQDEQGVPPLRAVRPMVADEFGQVDDPGLFEDFVCLVPPGADWRQTLDFALRARELITKTAKKAK